MKRGALVKALNAFLAAALLVLFGFHGVGNAFQLFGVGSVVPGFLAWMLLIIACLHAVVGVCLTVATFREQRRANVAYWRLNRRFWAVRASGLAIAVLVICHVVVFGQFGGGPFRLSYFGPVQLALNLLFVLSLAVHALANAHPLMISLGVSQPRARAADLGVVVSLLCLFMACAFAVYLIRWSVI